MLETLLTQNSTPIFKYIVYLLGIIMNGIYEVLDFIRIPNVGLVIILFTIVMYTLMLPLTFKQQKFSKFSAKMNPEIQAVQAKYKGKKDNQSMMAMNQETQAIYAKYGVSPAGSCIQMLVFLPVVFALYRVVYSIPAYVTKIKDIILGLVGGFNADDAEKFKVLFKGSKNLTQYLNKLDGSQNRFVDLVNHFDSADWVTLKGSADYAGMSNIINQTQDKLEGINNFCGLNIGYSPSSIVGTAMSNKNWFLVVGALLIPILAGLSQFISYKMMPQTATNTNGNDTASSMANSMKVMNYIMPIVSIFFTYSLQVAVGLYWIVSSVVRTVQQIFINRHIDKMDIDDMMKKNIEKNNLKRAKMGLPPQTLNANSNINTKNISTKRTSASNVDRAEEVRKSTEYYNKNAKPGSLASKANMVKQYNEKNNK